MAKHFTVDDRREILRLKDVEGLTHKEIALRFDRLTKSGEPNERAIMKQYKKAQDEGLVPIEPLESPSNETLEVPTESPITKVEEVAPIEEQPTRALNEMSRKERTAHLRRIMPQSARGKFLYTNVFNDVERELFEDEYFRILSEEDSFTAAEEGILFMAIVHWTLAMRAYKRDRETYEKSAQAGYKGQDQLMYSDQWTREAKDNMKAYKEMMKSLKLSREQRLQDMKRLGTTFLDFAERSARNNEQEKIAEEIMALEGASQEQLDNLQKNGWIIGGGLPNNNDCLYEPADVEKARRAREQASEEVEEQD